MTGVCCAPSSLMSKRGFDHAAIEAFVRDTLGCSCPDEVFRDIRVMAPGSLMAGADTVYAIGGRLLVAVVIPADWHAAKSRLAQMVEQGKHHRDAHGYNRFRLVVATDDAGAGAGLRTCFAALPAIDDRIHLHVIVPEKVPRRAHPGVE